MRRCHRSIAEYKPSLDRSVTVASFFYSVWVFVVRFLCLFSLYMMVCTQIHSLQDPHLLFTHCSICTCVCVCAICARAADSLWIAGMRHCCCHVLLRPLQIQRHQGTARLPCICPRLAFAQHRHMDKQALTHTDTWTSRHTHTHTHTHTLTLTLTHSHSHSHTHTHTLTHTHSLSCCVACSTNCSVTRCLRRPCL